MNKFNPQATRLIGNQMPLRSWQARCIQHALQTLSSTQPHFLCQATPGAGKMRMAAVLTDELMSRGDIDTVIYLGPSTSVVQRAAETLSEVTGQAMDGRLGAAGVAHTYHALQHRMEALKRLCQQSSVLLIWDESHHAAGRASEGMDGANQWGLALLALERYVRYTLALSGTPWRTDGSCLPLLRYIERPVEVDDQQRKATSADVSLEDVTELQLTPDFVYTLAEAIQDRVCRLPHMQLIDNPAIQLTTYHPRSGRQETHHYSSIPHLLRHPSMLYSQLLRHHEPMAHLLDRSCQQLAQLRQQDPDAAGLVMASDIAHAEEVAEQLEDRGQSVCLVTSKSPRAHKRLRAFRDASTAWIVAVGMVSEGVDIPRLRVCCYLSHIRTEQTFRQVLGRIIRREGADDAECYFFALNEPALRHFARRITDDLPEDLAKVSPEGTTLPAQMGATAPATPPAPPISDSPVHAAAAPAASAPDMPTTGSSTQAPQLSLNAASNLEESIEPDVAFSRRFIARLIALQLPSSDQS